MSKTSPTWHRIEDGLPERSGQYIVRVIFPGYVASVSRVVWFNRETENWFSHGINVDAVTHWHELPDDPE